MILFLLTQLAAAEIEMIWLDKSILDSKSFPKDIKLGFLEQEQGNALLFAIKDVDLQILQENNIAFQPHRESKSIPAGYRNTQAGIALMEEFALSHPDRVQLHTLGFSHQGRPILGVKISDTDDPINRWKILGTHHGDELSASEVSLDFITYIEEYIDYPVVEDWLQENELWIVPHVNPDGIEAVSRYNQNWVDLNRNYSWEWTSEEFLPGAHAFSEPETQAIRLLEEWSSFTGGLSLHSGASNISWVWNYSVTPTVDDSLVRRLAQDYADFCEQPNFWVVNGAEWYITYGDTTDWSYGAQGSFDLTLEVSEDKRPPASQLPYISSYHLPAIWNFLEWEHWISVKVYDAESEQPIRAAWQLLEDGIVDRGSASGRLTRLVESEGVWTAEISAIGYESQILTIETGQTMDIYLEKADDFQPIACLVQEAGFVDLAFPENFTEISIWRQGLEVTPLYKQGDSWMGEKPEILSGVYDLQTNLGWRRNALLIVDRWDDEFQEEENIWTIEDSVLALFSPTEETPRQCAFQIIEGQIIGFSTILEEPTEPIEPAEEPSSEEPAVEPAGELTDEASSEPKIGAGGCQMGANGKNQLPLWLGLLGLLGFTRQKESRIQSQ